MKESAEAAFSVVKANAKGLGIDPEVFNKLDFHIHVPAGAIPMDGPSAGVAMFTSLVSLLTNRAVDPTLAMTGEITLRGRVLPIGGLKEKALGALRAGIKTVVIPAKNKKELAEIPSVIKRKLKFIAVSNMDEVLDLALLQPEKKPRPKTKSTGARKR